MASPVPSLHSETASASPSPESPSSSISSYSPPDLNPSVISRSPSPSTISPDIARLQREHSNQGYIDGVTSGKSRSVQKGFDSGYPLGAELGLLVGQILGILQGLLTNPLHLQSSNNVSTPLSNSTISALDLSARNELLDLHSLFGDLYWNLDPTSGMISPNWLTGQSSGLSNSEIASLHPVIHKWLEITSNLIPPS
ncbi:uncharacterized protein V1516DRAFT_672013 [Lipomyces oligophaga]|uniref:uncharacterized protein n=1 Tax=Lipomyces oligophaga TaxID=45792 RepID=UPI0034CEB8E8